MEGPIRISGEVPHSEGYDVSGFECVGQVLLAFLRQTLTPIGPLPFRWPAHVWEPEESSGTREAWPAQCITCTHTGQSTLIRDPSRHVPTGPGRRRVCLLRPGLRKPPIAGLGFRGGKKDPVCGRASLQPMACVAAGHVRPVIFIFEASLRAPPTKPPPTTMVCHRQPRSNATYRATPRRLAPEQVPLHDATSAFTQNGLWQSVTKGRSPRWLDEHVYLKLLTY